MFLFEIKFLAQRKFICLFLASAIMKKSMAQKLTGVPDIAHSPHEYIDFKLHVLVCMYGKVTAAWTKHNSDI